MSFKVLTENAEALAERGYGAIGAGELDAEAKGKHVPFRAMRDGEELFAGVTDGHGHDELIAWARSMHGVGNVEFGQSAVAEPKATEPKVVKPRATKPKKAKPAESKAAESKAAD